MYINEIFEQALLAQAAYADNLTAAMTPSDLATKLSENDDITNAQAEYFSNRYKVVVQQETSKIADTHSSWKTISV